EVEASQAAYYSFLRTGEVPIEVFVLGSVRSTGVYAVGLGTTLDQLLALTGGVSLGEGRLERDVKVRLYHEVGGNRVLSYEQPLGQVLSGSPPLPSLEDGDVVVVDVQRRGASWFTLDNTLRLISVATSLILLIDRFGR